MAETALCSQDAQLGACSGYGRTPCRRPSPPGCLVGRWRAEASTMRRCSCHRRAGTWRDKLSDCNSQKIGSGPLWLPSLHPGQLSVLRESSMAKSPSAVQSARAGFPPARVRRWAGGEEWARAGPCRRERRLHGGQCGFFFLRASLSCLVLSCLVSLSVLLALLRWWLLR